MLEYNMVMPKLPRLYAQAIIMAMPVSQSGYKIKKGGLGTVAANQTAVTQLAAQL